MGTMSSGGKVFIILSVVILIFVLLIVLSGTWDSNKKIESVIINNTITVPKNDLQDSIFKLIANKQKNDIELLELTKYIEESKYIKSATVNFSGSNTLEIDINERIPVGFFAGRSGKVQYFDEDGIVLPFNEAYKSDDYLLVAGLYYDKQLKDHLKDAGVLINNLDKEEFTLLRTNISDITYDYQLKSFVLRTKNNQNFLVGDIHNINNKFNGLISYIINKPFLENDFLNIDCRWDGMLVMKN